MQFTFNGTQNLNMGTGAVSMNSYRQVTVNAKTLTVGGAISGTGLELTKTGPGVLLLTGANTYSGGDQVSGGTLVLQQQSNGGTITTESGAVAVWAMTADQPYNTIQPLTFTGAGRVNMTGNNYLYGDQVGGRITVNQPAGALFDIQGGTLAEGGGNGGAGTFISTKLGSVNVASGATLDMAQGNTTIDALTGGGTILDTQNGARTITLGAANDTSSADNPYFSGRTAIFTGVIRISNDPVALTKAGSGTQVLGGATNYTGATTISGGTLQLGTGLAGQDGSIDATSGVDISAGAALVFNLAGSDTVSYPITDAGALIKTGSGTLTLSGTNTYTGGTLIATNPAAIEDGTNLYVGTPGYFPPTFGGVTPSGAASQMAAAPAAVAPVPEPGTLALLAALLGGALAYRRLRRR